MVIGLVPAPGFEPILHQCYFPGASNQVRHNNQDFMPVNKSLYSLRVISMPQK